MRCRVCSITISTPAEVAERLLQRAARVAAVLSGSTDASDPKRPYLFRDTLISARVEMEIAAETLTGLCPDCGAAQQRAGRRLTRQDLVLHRQHLLAREIDSVGSCGYCLATAARRLAQDLAAPRAAGAR